MTSFAEPWRHVDVIKPTGPYGNSTDDKPFIHKANGLYYLSWGCFYGTSSSVYGPYTFRGSFLSTDFIEPAFRMNHTAENWYGSEDYADRHGSFFSANGQSFWSGNDRSHSADKANPGVFRDTVLAYVHYFSNASISPLVINGAGVGEYSSHVEAENFMAARGAALKVHDESGSFSVRGLASSSSLEYPHVRASASASRFSVRYASASGGELVVRSGSTGAELCRVPLEASASWDRFTVAEAQLALAGETPGDLSLLLGVEGEGEVARIDFFELL
jgi:arabinoxylan arabinofuranohydrolase